MQPNNQIIKRLAKKLETGFPQIAFAYLFGSAAAGGLSDSSDIDVAVFLKPAIRTPELIAGIIGAVEDIVSGHLCDLLILNDTGKLIAMEALKGKILFIRESSVNDHAEFYSLTCRMYEDQIAWMKKQLKYRGYEVQWDN
ncbi:MAG: nucleotidyltransferase domain-containing protein [Bacteroidetes bacterium]|nr:nucleotidyltransferase domain-containing protein [Bacteroidota bacterium]